jgi:hypothetical protein
MWACVVAAAVPLIVAACDTTTIEAVGSPGGVYRPGQGCTLAPDAPVCPAPGQAQAELQFESLTDPGLALDTAAGTLSDLRVTCTRSYCGSGSLEAHATLQWNDNDPNAPLRMASVAHAFQPAVDLMGRTISFNVFVDQVTVPMHAQVGVIFDYWRWVGWAPLSRGWNRIEGLVSPSNPLTKIDPAVTAIPVTSIRIDVYVPVADASGTQGSWTGEIFLDDVSW